MSDAVPVPVPATVGDPVTGPDGTVYDPADCRVGVRAGHSIVRVTLWHPRWGSAKTAALRAGLFGGAGASVASTGVDAAPDPAVARALLDAALGTDVVATWLGDIDVTDRSPDHAVSMSDLRDLVARMASSATDPDGRPGSTELRMELDGADAVVRTIVPLAPSVAPGRDRHAEVTLHIDPFRATDLTGAQVRSTVLATEDALSATVRENRAGLLVAVVHRAGEGTGHAGTGLGGVGLDDVVTLHYYLGAPGSGAAGSGTDAGAGDHPAGADGAVSGAADAADAGGAGDVDGAVTAVSAAVRAGMEKEAVDHVLNVLRATVSAWELGEASLTDDVDPTWSAVQRFRV